MKRVFSRQNGAVSNGQKLGSRPKMTLIERHGSDFGAQKSNWEPNTNSITIFGVFEFHFSQSWKLNLKTGCADLDVCFDM